MKETLAVIGGVGLLLLAFRAGRNNSDKVADAIETEMNTPKDPIETISTNEWSPRNSDVWGS